ncbi:MAG: type II/IV secretion system ATPase subunit [Candidatus Methanomethylophilaceae archaeon]|nr:type II/IV secretion system ATPase subunit [Candidatus Methanomethylophilaceae archaeon]
MEMIAPWRQFRIGPGREREMIAEGKFQWDDAETDEGPFFESDRETQPHDPLASKNDFTSLFGAMVVKDVRSKPSYTNCWLTYPSDVKVLSKYRTGAASVTIGLTDDGQTEYSVIPSEYSLPDDMNALISDVIRDIRATYRIRGGRLDRDSVMGTARSILTNRYDDVRKAYGEDKDVDSLINDVCSASYRHSVGAGIFEVLLSDPHIEDVYVDAPCDASRIHVTVNGVEGVNAHMRCRTNLIIDRMEMGNLINILKRESGLRFCQSSPVLETDFKEFDARATVIGFPMSPNGEALAIRKHSVRPWTLTRLIANGTIDARSAGLLSFLVNNRSTFLICGARGAGKSSLLAALMFEFPLGQRILTIEDTIELPGEQMRSLGYKIQTLLMDDRSGDGHLSGADEALRVSLRMGESAIVVGEVRGEEARILYQSMRTGKAGSAIMGTIHGESAKSVYDRMVHDMGIAPEAFMATDVVVTLGTVKDRRTGNLARRVNELVVTSYETGKFVDATDQTRLLDTPVMKRAMQTSRLGKMEAMKEIRARAAMRAYLAEIGKRKERFLEPEWILLANDILSRMPPTATAESVLEELKRRTVAAGARFGEQDRQQKAAERMPDGRRNDDVLPGIGRLPGLGRQDDSRGGAGAVQDAVLEDIPQDGH